jgi:hypothetical protein
MGSTAAAREQYNLENGNSEQQTLYPSVYGGKSAVETAKGLSMEPQNSWVEQDESIWNPSTGYARYISHGPNDSAKANLKPEDVVFGNKRDPFTNKKFKDEAKPLIIAKEILNKNKPNAKGWLANNTIDTYNKVSNSLHVKLDEQL